MTTTTSSTHPRLLGLALAVLVLLVGVSLAGNCGPQFKGKCSCGKAMYDNRMQYVVNCTDQEFRYADLTALEHLPKETEVFIFTGNYLPLLPWNIFGTINNLSALRIVDMSNNHIHEIQGKSFHHVPNVQRLILNHNNLSISRVGDRDSPNYHHPRVFSNFINLRELHLTNTFEDSKDVDLSEDLHDIFVNSNLSKLIKLHLEQNEISHFKDKRVFCDLISLRDLYLGDNLLKEINFNILCLKNLRFLDLERNKFETVKMKDMMALDSLQDAHGKTVNVIVDFTYNPFSCDCALFPFVQWVNDTSVQVRNKEHYTCKTTTTRRGKEEKEEEEENINKVNIKRCKVQSKNKHTSTGHEVTLVLLLVILTCILLGLIGVLMYVSKERMRKYLQPLHNATKKVHYTTIKDEEVPEVHV